MIRTIELNFVRHGETTANRDGILQGHCDFPLTELGIEQGHAVGKRLAGNSWKRVYSSDLTRAMDTTKLILRQREIMMQERNNSIVEPVHISLLREISFGLREGLPKGTSVKQAVDIYSKAHNISKNDVIDTAETLHQVKERQKQFLQHIYNDLYGSGVGAVDNSGASRMIDNQMTPTTETGNDDGEVVRILCVSHGAFIKAFLKHFCEGLDVPSAIGNCSLSTVLVQFQCRPFGVAVTVASEEEGCDNSAGQGLNEEMFDFRCTTTISAVNQM